MQRRVHVRAVAACALLHIGIRPGTPPRPGTNWRSIDCLGSSLLVGYIHHHLHSKFADSCRAPTGGVLAFCLACVSPSCRRTMSHPTAQSVSRSVGLFQLSLQLVLSGADDDGAASSSRWAVAALQGGNWCIPVHRLFRSTCSFVIERHPGASPAGCGRAARPAVRALCRMSCASPRLLRCSLDRDLGSDEVKLFRQAPSLRWAAAMLLV